MRKRTFQDQKENFKSKAAKRKSLLLHQVDRQVFQKKTRTTFICHSVGDNSQLNYNYIIDTE